MSDSPLPTPLPDGPQAPTPLDRRLMEPVESLPLAALADGWFHQTVTLTVAGGGMVASDPAFPGRLRGAFERALMTGASDTALAGGPCPWDPPCAYGVLVRDHGTIASGLTLPRPMVMRAAADGADLAVMLTLFGFACDWITAAADALTAGVRGGITLPVGETRITGRRIDSFDGVAVPMGARAVALDFLTPVSLRGGTDPRRGLAGFVGALANRVFGLARWHDAHVLEHRRSLLAAADRVRVDATGLHRMEWRRGSVKQDRWLPMEGETGTLILDGPLDPLLPLLALGAVVHAGARTTFGQGAYRLHVLE